MTRPAPNRMLRYLELMKLRLRCPPTDPRLDVASEERRHGRQAHNYHAEPELQETNQADKVERVDEVVIRSRVKRDLEPPAHHGDYSVKR